MALQSRQHLTGSNIRLCCLLASVILVLFGNSISHSQERSAPKADLSFGSELQKGIALVQKGDFKKADEAFEQAVILHPRDPRTLTALGQVQGQLGELPESIETFGKVIEIDPLSPEAPENLGISLADRADLAAALKESSIATRLAPSSASAHFLRGRLLSDLGSADEARREFRKTLQISLENPQALYYWAVLEGDGGNTIIQANLLKRYVRVRPDQARAFDQLGHLPEEQHHELEAVQAWRRAVALNPEYSVAIYCLARVLKRTNPSESKRLMERVHEQERDQQTIDRRNMLGNQANEKIYGTKHKGAIDDLNNAIALCGSCKLLGALEKNLGLAYCHAGQRGKGSEN